MNRSSPGWEAGTEASRVGQEDDSVKTDTWDAGLGRVWSRAQLVQRQVQKGRQAQMGSATYAKPRRSWPFKNNGESQIHFKWRRLAEKDNTLRFTLQRGPGASWPGERGKLQSREIQSRQERGNNWSTVGANDWRVRRKWGKEGSLDNTEIFGMTPQFLVWANAWVMMPLVKMDTTQTIFEKKTGAQFGIYLNRAIHSGTPVTAEVIPMGEINIKAEVEGEGKTNVT